MNERVSNACRTTIGLFIGSAASLLLYEGASYIPFVANNRNLLEIVLIAFTFAICGIILGIVFAFGRREHLSLRQAAQGFGLGFLIAGIIYFLSYTALKNEYDYVFNRAVVWVHFLFIFTLAGALSAVFTRSRLFSVANSVISVATGLATIVILSSIFNEIFEEYLLTRFLVYFTLFCVITGALLKTHKKEAATNYLDIVQPQS
jgi:hypothetical protein